MAIPLDASWMEVLGAEFEQEYMQKLFSFLDSEEENSIAVYPPRSLVFNAFNHTPFKKVKIVLLGQDPYIGPHQAHGLSFSIEKGNKLPPSLKNIFKELDTDLEEFQYPAHGNLTSWADQGVFLLNSILTVQAGASLSHQNKGWEKFTDQAISELSSRRQGLVFLLWGKFAQSKSALIDTSKHTVLTAAHPSPFSARHGFFGCRHFSKTNNILKEQGKAPINWQI